MSAVLWVSVVLLLLFACYHTLRDVGTEFFGLTGSFWNLRHRGHTWCGPTCGVITLPLELFNIAASSVVLARRRLGRLALVNLGTVALWLLAWFLP